MRFTRMREARTELVTYWTCRGRHRALICASSRDVRETFAQLLKLVSGSGSQLENAKRQFEDLELPGGVVAVSIGEHSVGLARPYVPDGGVGEHPIRGAFRPPRPRMSILMPTLLPNREEAARFIDDACRGRDMSPSQW